MKVEKKTIVILKIFPKTIPCSGGPRHKSVEKKGNTSYLRQRRLKKEKKEKNKRKKKSPYTSATEKE